MNSATTPQLYIDLLKRIVTGQIIGDTPKYAFWHAHWTGWFLPDKFEPRRRERGKDVPSLAHTMIGNRRLDNVHDCMESVLRDGVPGDFIETGVWRGGTTIFMRGLLKAYAVTDRKVWVADSFEGLPKPNAKRYPADRWMRLDLYRYYAVTEETVRANFAKYDLLDDQVRFLKGWFRDTLPAAPIDKLALLRLDGDLYESTLDALTHLYPKLSPGGYVIVDDYIIPACRKAVHDYRKAHGIEDPILDIDGVGTYWRRGWA
jgi:hypothetical protein